MTAHAPRTILTPVRSLVLALLLGATALLAGCHDLADDPLHLGGDGHDDHADLGDAAHYTDLGFDGETWPDLTGQTVVILDHGAFAAFDSAKAAFEELTGATVDHIEADDTGSALNRAVLESGDPSFDILYGIDNILLHKAIQENVFEAYEPILAHRIDPAYMFYDTTATGWLATPVDHGYIGLNVDTDHETLSGASIDDLDDVVAHADTFVTQDPRTSTPGLGFLIATVASYGEAGNRTWTDYWADLFAGNVLVTSGWSEAYMQHFSAAGTWVGESDRDRAIVTSYTESPAYEAFFGMNQTDLAKPITATGSTFHQIQTMGIVNGAPNRIAAEAWIEFTLTDAFQTLAAPDNAVYPVTTTEAARQSITDTYGGIDPAPGSFTPAGFGFDHIGKNVERWVNEWVTLCEQHDCA